MSENKKHICSALLFTLMAMGNAAAFAQTNVNIMLQEWRMMSDKTHIPAGKVKFSVQNRGQETHELVLLKTNMAYDAIPLQSAGGIDEKNAGVLVDELEDITSKSGKSMTVTLAPGKYVLLCNMVEMEAGKREEHYAMGMRVPLIVE
ncbi:MAG: cupredoxin domain-containing protein [Gammaproteobacteria bacterium]|nr:cupredoxin domain-containing protein [Gammaproteobacteria bacterium]